VKSLLLCTALVLLPQMTAFAQSEKELRDISLSACKEQVAALTKPEQKSALARCKCTVKNTDYSEIASASNAGDLQKVEALALQAAQQCSAKNESD